MTRPRESILNLFDPLNLNDPSTPKRELVPGTRSPDSDKENSEPTQVNAGEITAFFNRTYSRTLAPAHMKPMKRLVDVGDLTVALDEEDVNGGLGMVIEDDDDEKERQKATVNDLEVGDIPRPEQILQVSSDDMETPMQRAPFADITPEATPIPPKRTYRHEGGDFPSPRTVTQQSPGITRAPPGSPLASIINAINFAGPDIHTSTSGAHVPQISVSSPGSTPSETSDALSSSIANLIPSCTSALISHTTNPSPTPSDSLMSSTAHLVPSTTSALLTHIPPLSDSVCRPSPPPCPLSSSTPGGHLRPRSNADTNASSHIRPASVDLHSSFNIHLQNPESSFDLLNDRISFFGLGLDTSLGGMGMESSLLGRELETDVSIGGVTLGEFDLKNEEERMKTFLRMSAGWEDGGKSLNSSGGTKEKSISNYTEVLSPSNRASVPTLTAISLQLTSKPSAGITSSSAETTPKVVGKTTMTKRRLSSPLSSVPSLKKTLKYVFPFDSPPKPEDHAPKSRHSLDKLPFKLNGSPLATEVHTCTPSKVAYVAPAPVPALRIVKRATAQTHEKQTSISSLAAARPPISAPRPLMPASPPAPVEKPAPTYKRALQGVQRPRPSKAATVAAPQKITLSFPSGLTKPNVGTIPKTAKTIGPGNNTVKQTTSAGMGVVGKSKLARPASVIGYIPGTTKTTTAPSQIPSKLRPISTTASALRPPAKFGGSSVKTTSIPAAGPPPKAGLPGATTTRLLAPVVKPANRVGSSIPMVDRRMRQ